MAASEWKTPATILGIIGLIATAIGLYISYNPKPPKDAPGVVKSQERIDYESDLNDKIAKAQAIIDDRTSNASSRSQQLRSLEAENQDLYNKSIDGLSREEAQKIMDDRDRSDASIKDIKGIIAKDQDEIEEQNSKISEYKEKLAH